MPAPDQQAAIRLAVAVAALAGLAGAPDAAAAGRTLRLDPRQTTIAFQLGATLHTVDGTFRLTEGEVRFDPESRAASGRVVVDATSGDTQKEKRDAKMHSQVLESDEYPEIVFVPEALDGAWSADGSSDVVVSGTIEIHGSGHRVSIPAEVRTDGDRLEATCSFRLPYVEWGMQDPSFFMLRVEKHVTVTIHAVGRLQ